MYTIRRATLDDLEIILDLRMAFLRESHPEAAGAEPVTREANRRYIGEKLPAGELLIWLAEEDGQVIGTSGLVFFHRPPTLRNQSTMQAYLMNMYTLPDCRGRGVATALLREIVDYVGTTPAKRIYLHATDSGRPVYERIGFKPADSGMVLVVE